MNPPTLSDLQVAGIVGLWVVLVVGCAIAATFFNQED